MLILTYIDFNSFIIFVFFVLLILASFLINNEGKISKSYICPKCGKKYKHQPSLCNHRRYECGVLPQFRCRMCNRLFSRSHRLRTHIMISHNKTYHHTSN
uniref:Longitudinals lacking protein, isoforms A/B/D/L n=1 Tax=Melanaphis sacchari TaxID=742174 RepID=A0A2H8TJA4_9HEMI